MKKVSVIVPVYNAEKYLKECICSIINQTYSNLEIILIDDGSTDNSSLICDEFKLKDQRITVIHKKNNGVSAARNTGLDIATGDYVVFVDSDDYIGKNYINSLVEGILNVDLAICGYNEYYLRNNVTHRPYLESNISNFEAINLLFKDSSICGFLVNKIYKKNVIDNNNIRLHTDIFICEDLLFNVEYFTYIKNVKIINEVSYYYRMRKSSATWKKNDLKFDNVNICFDYINKILEKYNVNKYYFKLFSIESLLKLSNKKFNHSTELCQEFHLVFKTINLKKKIIFFILKNVNQIYKIYMFIKIKRFGLFE